MDSHDSEDDPKPTKLRLPNFAVLLAVALLVLCGCACMAFLAARSGIRRVESLGGDVECRWSVLSDLVTDVIDADSALLATDGDVRTVWLVGPQFTDDVMPVFHRFSSVEDVWIHESNVTDDGLDPLTTAREVTDLQIYDSPKITQTGMAKLAKLPRLSYLDLEGMPVTGEGVARIVTLETLYMDRCPSVDDATLQRISSLPNLTILSVTGSSVTDAGLRHLAGLARLESFYLDGTQITDAGLQSLIAACPNLTMLSLDNVSGITDAGVLELAAMKSLVALYIQDTNISAEAVEKLQQALPGCEVSHDWLVVKNQ